MLWGIVWIVLMSPFSWQCQNLCLLSLAFITDWRVVLGIKGAYIVCGNLWFWYLWHSYSHAVFDTINRKNGQEWSNLSTVSGLKSELTNRLTSFETGWNPLEASAAATTPPDPALPLPTPSTPFLRTLSRASLVSRHSTPLLNKLTSLASKYAKTHQIVCIFRKIQT